MAREGFWPNLALEDLYKQAGLLVALWHDELIKGEAPNFLESNWLHPGFLRG